MNQLKDKKELHELLKRVIPMGIKTDELNLEGLALLIVQASFTRYHRQGFKEPYTTDNHNTSRC